MPAPRMIRAPGERFPLIGPSLWILSVQYFVVQLVVARAWPTPYGISSNTISDLGNTACGPYGGRAVCSPLHDLMNASLVVLGITMFIGAVLIYRMFSRSFASAVGFGCMATGGLGTILVGLFPENTVSALHIIGAALPFLIGNLGMVLLGTVLVMPRILRCYTVTSGLVSLAALVLLLTGHYFGLDIGGMERVTAYPQTVWLILFGLYAWQR